MIKNSTLKAVSFYVYLPHYCYSSLPFLSPGRQQAWSVGNNVSCHNYLFMFVRWEDSEQSGTALLSWESESEDDADSQRDRKRESHIFTLPHIAITLNADDSWR